MKNTTDVLMEKYLPKISNALEEIALGLNYLRRLENKEVAKDGHGELITKATRYVDTDTCELERI